MDKLEGRPDTNLLIRQVLSVWPDHEAYLEKSFRDRSEPVMAACERLSSAILRMAQDLDGGLSAVAEDYKYFSERVVIPEQLHFQRTGSYSTKTFSEANEKYYSDGVFMRRYSNCLALSTVLWENHANVFAKYVNGYLPSLEPGCSLMEIGPAHGFALYFAAAQPNVTSLTGWDVSPTAIEHTRRLLQVFGVDKPLVLKVQDLFEAGDPPPGGGFDAIVIGEVIEHLEDPRGALRAVSAWLRPHGRMWITTPVNSPFPDHIHLFRTIEEVHELIGECGLAIDQHEAFPMSGVTLEKAIKRKQPISCVITATKAA